MTTLNQILITSIFTIVFVIIIIIVKVKEVDEEVKKIKNRFDDAHKESNNILNRK